MDINQNLEQINTFEKGMNTDVSDTLLPNNQYRYAENLRFTSHDTDNTGELQPIKGMLLVYDMKSLIIATSLIRDIGIFITGTRKNWCIRVLNKDFKGTFKKDTIIFGPCTDELGEHVSIVTRYENEKDIKVYIADGEHQLMAINIMHEDGYGASAPRNIKYLTSYSDVCLLQAETSIVETSGGLKPAVIQYTYVLYREGGAVTRYAPFTRPIYLLKADGKGYLANEATNKAVRITIDINSILLNGLNRILIYRITYSQYGQDPEIYLIYDEKLNGNIDYTDTGVNITSHGKSEFLKNETYDKIKAATIESKGNYLFAGNIEDLQDEVDALWRDVNFLNGEYIDLELIRGSYGMTYDGKVPNRWKDEYHASLMPGETYEYGIVLYDENGRRSSVKFLKEITVPSDIRTIEFTNPTIDDDFTYKYTMHPIGVRVVFRKPIHNCSGYEIVRALRGANESRTLYQGVIGFPVADKVNISTPSFLTTTGLYPCADNVKSIQDVVIFACPECVYLPTETQQRMSSLNTSLKHVVDYTVPIENISADVFNEATVSGDYFLNHTGTTADTINLEASLALAVPVFNWWSETIQLSLSNDVVNKNYNEVYASNANFPYCTILNLAIGKSLYLEDYNKKRATFKINLPTLLSRDYYYTEGTVENRSDGTLIEKPFFIDIDLTGPILHDEEINGHITPYVCPYAYTDQFRDKAVMTWSSYIDPKEEYSRNEWGGIFNITDFKIADSFKPSDTLVLGDLYAGWDLYKYIIGKYTYCNFVKETRLINLVGGFEYGEGAWCSTYAGGKSLLLSIDRNVPMSFDPKDVISRFPYTLNRNQINSVAEHGVMNITNDSIDKMLLISVANITNNSYTGYGLTKDLDFCSFGNYYKYDNLQKDIFDGDTYINVFRYNHTHTIQQSEKYQVGASIVYMVPLHSSIDLSKASGDLIPDINQQHKYFFLDYLGKMLDLYLQEHDAYIYNAAYSQEMNLMSYHPVTYTEVHSGKFDTRIKVSEEKSNGERFDSWLNFSVTGTLDADTRFGEITHMRLFKDALIFWLKEATGIVSVNERVIVQDMNDTNLLLGTGGVLLRFDYLSTKYGMQKPYITETLSDVSLYFWDAYKKEILAYAGGQHVQPMVESKTVKNYINNNLNVKDPCFVYDSEHNEILMRVVDPDTCIVYNEFVNLFTSVYRYAFQNSIYFNDKLWLTYNNLVYQPNAGEYIQAKLQYIVNKNSTMVKVFDNVRMGINQVSNDYFIQTAFELPDEQSINLLLFKFKSPQQYSETLVNITDREYDYRFAVPRAQIYDGQKWNDPEYGQRMRGKYLISNLIIPEHQNNAKNAFSLQYITTKFRISYS